ncbi:MAG: hypothetical protein HZB68_00990 [Candidatus Aenigmarchaeota archaeon]|nr:hypothetical protein [Candidatus Aenigmarchaeota archaeon]
MNERIVLSVILAVFISGCVSSPVVNPNITESPTLAQNVPIPIILSAWTSGQPGSLNLLDGANASLRCNIKPWTLPANFILNNTLNNCTIAGLHVLSSGSTASISEPIILTIDYGNGQKRDFEFKIVVVEAPPTMAFNPPGTCFLNEYCDIDLIAGTSGGFPPYHFQSDTFREGAPPFGTVVNTEGHLVGTVTHPSQLGNHAFGVCISDTVAASTCGKTNVIVSERTKDDDVEWYQRLRLMCVTDNRLFIEIPKDLINGATSTPTSVKFEKTTVHAETIYQPCSASGTITVVKPTPTSLTITLDTVLDVAPVTGNDPLAKLSTAHSGELPAKQDLFVYLKGVSDGKVSGATTHSSLTLEFSPK